MAGATEHRCIRTTATDRHFSPSWIECGRSGFVDTAHGFRAVILRPYRRNAGPFWPSKPHPGALRHHGVFQAPLFSGFRGVLSRSSRPLGRRGHRCSTQGGFSGLQATLANHGRPTVHYRRPVAVEAGVSACLRAERGSFTWALLPLPQSARRIAAGNVPAASEAARFMIREVCW